ncbi:hypothetical protein Pr1d_17710 [Bythopirellula goksoeyrii]|uniref:Uncharacterized protein n=1 Tax=Bythopirellula goksoeyrii TaxID=1400387 RepID=A0A5B9QK15_9BACT|nr:hypothetical protein Pr1d_17710 [Bythopirellula goksoeyrii]
MRSLEFGVRNEQDNPSRDATRRREESLGARRWALVNRFLVCLFISVLSSLLLSLPLLYSCDA